MAAAVVQVAKEQIHHLQIVGEGPNKNDQKKENLKGPLASPIVDIRV